MHRVLQIKTPLRTAAAGALRNLIRDRVRALDGVALDDDRAYALLVASSEVVTNALKFGREHADEETELLVDGEIDSRRRRLRITVTDPRPTVPKMGSRAEDLDATGGRGITVVAGYVDDVGWYQRLDADGRPVGWCVWFELDVELLETFGRATAATAEVQPEPFTPPARHPKVVALAHRMARLHVTIRRGRARAA
ncbi:ATP-binding protein [Kitasatospora purpeofusca]|uniref:ATP-binding protein n=1 Tax=Kitasatospora purpeofusca TaxID=67352 RepID=UPI0036EC2890